MFLAITPRTPLTLCSPGSMKPRLERSGRNEEVCSLSIGDEGRLLVLSDLAANRTSSLVIRPDDPVPEIDEMSTVSSRASFRVAGEALTFGATVIKFFCSSIRELSLSGSLSSISKSSSKEFS